MKKLIASMLLLSLTGCYVAQPAPPVAYAPAPAPVAAPGYYYPPGYYAPAPTVYGPPVSVGIGIGCCGYWHRH